MICAKQNNYILEDTVEENHLEKVTHSTSFPFSTSFYSNSKKDSEMAIPSFLIPIEENRV